MQSQQQLKPNSRLTYPLLMGTAKTYQHIDIPAGVYSFLSVQNNTNNTITFYAGKIAPADTVKSTYVGEIPPRTALTLPIDKRADFTAIWQDGGGTDRKEANLVFSVENLNINTQLGSATSADVSITTDTVGLARQNQLPVALTGTGQFKVSVEEIKSATATKHTTVGDNTVKATAGKVYAVSATGGNVEIKDGATPRFFVTSGQTHQFNPPLACTTSIIANLSAVGSAYVQYE